MKAISLEAALAAVRIKLEADMPSTHFTTAELACPHCRQNLCGQKTYDMLEQFRAKVGKPVIVTSGYRCEQHNRECGGAPRSQHLLGFAADIRVDGMTAAELESVARECPAIIGIGRDDHRAFLHIDCRDSMRAEWCYGVDGEQCGYYPPTTASLR